MFELLAFLAVPTLVLLFVYQKRVVLAEVDGGGDDPTVLDRLAVELAKHIEPQRVRRDADGALRCRFATELDTNILWRSFSREVEIRQMGSRLVVSARPALFKLEPGKKGTYLRVHQLRQLAVEAVIRTPSSAETPPEPPVCPPNS